MNCECGDPACVFEKRFRALVKEVLANGPWEWISLAEAKKLARASSGQEQLPTQPPKEQEISS